MIFLVWNPHARDGARFTGRVLAKRAGLRGMSLATLSELLGLAHRFPGGAL